MGRPSRLPKGNQHHRAGRCPVHGPWYLTARPRQDVPRHDPGVGNRDNGRLGFVIGHDVTHRVERWVTTHLHRRFHNHPACRIESVAETRAQEPRVRTPSGGIQDQIHLDHPAISQSDGCLAGGGHDWHTGQDGHAQPHKLALE